MRDIEEQTVFKLSKPQIEKLKEALRNNEYTKLSPQETLKHRKEFNSVKNKLISEWKNNTGQTWPRYTEVVYDKNGEIARNVGDYYDAHHIIENNYNGNHEWWNITPAKFPDEHQGGLHRSKSPCRRLFK